MTCHRIADGIICVSPFYRLPLSDGTHVFMEWHSYLGPTFFRDRACMLDSNLQGSNRQQRMRRPRPGPLTYRAWGSGCALKRGQPRSAAKDAAAGQKNEERKTVGWVLLRREG